MLYGEEAENGVIKVYTKIYINKHPEESPKLSTYIIYKPHLALLRMNSRKSQSNTGLFDFVDLTICPNSRPFLRCNWFRAFNIIFK